MTKLVNIIIWGCNHRSDKWAYWTLARASVVSIRHATVNCSTCIWCCQKCDCSRQNEGLVRKQLDSKTSNCSKHLSHFAIHYPNNSVLYWVLTEAFLSYFKIFKWNFWKKYSSWIKLVHFKHTVFTTHECFNYEPVTIIVW